MEIWIADDRETRFIDNNSNDDHVVKTTFNLDNTEGDWSLTSQCSKGSPVADQVKPLLAPVCATIAFPVRALFAHAASPAVVKLSPLCTPREQVCLAAARVHFLVS
jgi:hypothetical protein